MQAPDRLIRNTYSLMGSPSDTSSYQISVLKVEDSRGGSHFMHDHVNVGTELEISEPLNLFPPAKLARKHILVAGGIGITPFMSMMSELEALNAEFELHYGVRSFEEGAFCKLLESRYGPRIHLYFQDKGQFVPLEQVLSNQSLGTHVYVCGPKPMIDWALRTATIAGWPDEKSIPSNSPRHPEGPTRSPSSSRAPGANSPWADTRSILRGARTGGRRCAPSSAAARRMRPVRDWRCGI